MRRHDSGALATTPESITQALQRAFADDARLWRHWHHHLQGLARPQAARIIAAQVLEGVASPRRGELAATAAL
jgi:processive 1,2-diacylglycerol beta-glucosyltransferase